MHTGTGRNGVNTVEMLAVSPDRILTRMGDRRWIYLLRWRDAPGPLIHGATGRVTDGGPARPGRQAAGDAPWPATGLRDDVQHRHHPDATAADTPADCPS